MTDILTPLCGVPHREAIEIMRKGTDLCVIAPPSKLPLFRGEPRRGWLVVRESPPRDCRGTWWGLAD